MYVPPGDVSAFAESVLELLDDDDRRAALGTAARRRAEEVLDWRPQAAAYTRVYDELWDRLDADGRPSWLQPVASPAPSRDRWGNQFIEVHDDDALRQFAAYRSVLTRIREAPPAELVYEIDSA